MGRTGNRLDATRMGPEAERLREKLDRQIVGQDEALRDIVDVYQMFVTGMNPPGRPVGNFLFLGPTGSGKTRTVEATAESLVGTTKAVLKVDCGEFQHSHEIAKLIGSPPGYLGHRETHPVLNQDALNQYHTPTLRLSFVLFDEIEKASDALWNLLLGILDKATLTLGDGKRVDFSRAMIFMTSNLGSDAMQALLNPRLGFTSSVAAPTGVKVSQAAVDAARRRFSPEFVNRLDKIVVFQPLGASELKRVLDLELRQVQDRIFRSTSMGPFVLTTSVAAKQHLLEHGVDPRYGARHLKRAVERLLVQPISNLVASGQIHSGDWIRTDFDGAAERLTFQREAEGVSVTRMAEMADGSGLAVAA